MMFKPLQILDVNSLNRDILYNEYLPETELTDFISCYWILKSKEYLLKGIEHKVLPDGCIDIIFDLENKNTVIAGIMNETENMILKKNINLIGIRFLPRAIPFIMKGEAKELVNKVINAKNVCGELSELYKKALELNSEKSILNLINTELKKFFSNYKINTVFLNILKICTDSYGIIRVQKLSELSGISERQIGRYFNENIGISTKEFLSIMRFQKILSLMKEGKKVSEEFLDCGFYDQSHLIKEIKKYM